MAQENFEEFLQLEMDFNDNDTRIFNLTNGTHFVRKKFNISGLFVINVRVVNKNITLNPIIIGIFNFFPKFF